VTSYISLSGLLIAAAITPGPNNLIVLESAAQGGIMAAARPIIGVLTGSLALLIVTWFGLEAVSGSVPRFELLIATLGATYLMWLGATLAFETRPAGDAAAGLPAGVANVALFQFANPKSWVLVATSAAAVSATGSIFVLAGLMSVISLLCLASWAGVGTALSKLLRRARNRILFNRAMGTLLMISAFGVLFDGLR